MSPLKVCCCCTQPYSSVSEIALWFRYVFLTCLLTYQALAFDNEKKYQEAIKEYGDAIQHFMHVVKWEKNEALAGTVKEKVDVVDSRPFDNLADSHKPPQMMGYFNRAEELKKFMKEEEDKAKNPPKKASAEGGGEYVLLCTVLSAFTDCTHALMW